MQSASRTGLGQCQCFFVTASFRDWLPLFLQDSYYPIVVDALRFVCTMYDTRLVSFVLLPNEVHLVVFFEGESRLHDFTHDFTLFTAEEIRRCIQSEDPNELADKLRFADRDRYFNVWKDRFRFLELSNRNVLSAKINRIHQLPVQRGLCECAEDWKWSSAEWYTNHTCCVLPLLDVLYPE